jgi:hypothetical protein
MKRAFLLLIVLVIVFAQPSKVGAYFTARTTGVTRWSSGDWNIPQVTVTAPFGSTRQRLDTSTLPDESQWHNSIAIPIEKTDSDVLLYLNLVVRKTLDIVLPPLLEVKSNKGVIMERPLSQLIRSGEEYSYVIPLKKDTEGSIEILLNETLPDAGAEFQVKEVTTAVLGTASSSPEAAPVVTAHDLLAVTTECTANSTQNEEYLVELEKISDISHMLLLHNEGFYLLQCITEDEYKNTATLNFYMLLDFSPPDAPVIEHLVKETDAEFSAELSLITAKSEWQEFSYTLINESGAETTIKQKNFLPNDHSAAWLENLVLRVFDHPDISAAIVRITATDALGNSSATESDLF